MHVVIPTFAVLLAIMGLLTWATIWSRREIWIRTAAINVFLVSVLLIPLGGLNVLGWHRPARFGPDDKMMVLAYKLVRDEAIYLYVDRDGEPISLVLPWSDKDAEDLTRAGRRAREEGDKEGRFMYERLAGERQFYAPPQLPLPEKGE